MAPIFAHDQVAPASADRQSSSGDLDVYIAPAHPGQISLDQPPAARLINVGVGFPSHLTACRGGGRKENNCFNRTVDHTYFFSTSAESSTTFPPRNTLTISLPPGRRGRLRPSNGRAPRLPTTRCRSGIFRAVPSLWRPRRCSRPSNLQPRCTATPSAPVLSPLSKPSAPPIRAYPPRLPPLYSPARFLARSTLPS